jgi:hypothetical protein
MTNELRELLQQYGIVSVSLSQLAKEPPGNKYDSLETYYRDLGHPLPDEPALVVRISNDGQFRSLKEGEHDVELKDEQGNKASEITVWEMPEDEFWFFKAFRPGLFDLEKDLPRFLYEMAITYIYSLFEAYLADILRYRLKKHPLLMGDNREMKYKDIFAARSKEDLVSRMIDREINDLFYSPIHGLLHKMREKYGFKHLTSQLDSQVRELSLVRNCLLHNRGHVDGKLASVDTNRKEGDRIKLALEDVSRAVDALRSLAYQIDLIFEQI